RHDAGYEHRRHAGLSCSNELIGATITDEQTLRGQRTECSKAPIVDCALRLCTACDAGENFDVEQASERTGWPSRHFHDIRVGDQTETQTGRPKHMECFDVLRRNSLQ